MDRPGRLPLAAMGPFASGVHVNALSDDGADGVRRGYGPGTLERLTASRRPIRPGQRLPPEPQHPALPGTRLTLCAATIGGQSAPVDNVRILD